MPLLAPARRPGLPTLLFVAVLAGVLSFAGRAAVAQPAIPKRILVAPTLQWDSDGVRWRFLAQQTETDLGRLMAGLTFGLRPEQVNPLLPHPVAAPGWADMPVAEEFADEVRYTWLHMKVADELMKPVQACFGPASYIVLLFRTAGLFRVSWRFLPDPSCPDVTRAAAEMFATFVPIASTVALAVHYRTGYAEVVDVTDPRAGLLVTQRWQMPGQ